MFTPNAKADDGILDVVVADNIPKLKVLRILPTAFKGEHTGFDGIHIFTCKQVRLEAEEKLALHTDGESCGFQNFAEMSLEPKMMPIIVG